MQKYLLAAVVTILLSACAEQENALMPTVSSPQPGITQISQEKINFVITSPEKPLAFELKSGLAYSCRMNLDYSKFLLEKLAEALGKHYPNARFVNTAPSIPSDDLVASAKVDLTQAVGQVACNNVTCKIEMHLNARLAVTKRSGETIKSDNFASGSADKTNYLRLGGLCPMISEITTAALGEIVEKLPSVIKTGVDKALSNQPSK